MQIDGSDHEWFEKRGPRCTLIVYVDDATSKLLELRFCPSDSAFDYFDATTKHLKRYGRPVAYYNDKHSVFRVAKKDKSQGVIEKLSSDGRCGNSTMISPVRTIRRQKPV